MNRRIIGVLAALVALAVCGFGLVVVMLTGLVATPEEETADCGTGGGVVAPAVQVGTGPGVEVAARAALAAGWTGADAVTAVAIAGAESSDPVPYNPLAANTGSTARGLWQIMLSFHQAKFHGADWRDPAANARVAHQIWAEAGGWSPWTTYTSGAYKSHLGEAFTAVQKASGLPTLTDAAGLTGPNTVNVTNNGGTLKPAAQQAAAVVRERFGFGGTIYGFDNRNIAGTDKLSLHALGQAIDVMLPVGPESDAIADYFAGPAYKALGVWNVIHNRRIFNEQGWHAYTGANPHTDHVHIDFHDTGAIADAATLADPALCGAPGGAGAGTVVYPIDPSTDSHNYGNSGAVWARGHTGTDFSTACGTPVKAATGGTVVIDTTQGWAGRWLVKVSTGPRKLTTWYAHMQALNVSAGETVTPGQVIGKVGELGNTTGCHLHFEVHPRGGGIYEDGVDPSTWLASNVGRNLGGGPVPASNPAGDGFTLATFNALGASHTAAGGKRAELASGSVRTAGLVQLLTEHRVDVAGLQEFQGPQQAAFRARAGSAWGMWGNSDNVVVWRRGDYTVTGTDTLTIPYFEGNPRRMPMVRLRDTAGNQAWFLNVHNPADTREHPRQGAHRAEAVRREVAAVRRLPGPVFVTGDMNDRAAFYCPFTAGTGMVAAAGGSNTGTCRPPSPARIDWIMASVGTRFAGYTVDRSDLVRRTSDHPFVAAQAFTE